MVVSAGPAGSITVTVRGAALSVESWDISGFEIVELEERADRIEVELTDGQTEVELEVRLKDDGELRAHLEVG